MTAADEWRTPSTRRPVRARVTAPVTGAGGVDAALAAAFAAAGLVTGGTVLVRNWPDTDSADVAASVFADMGGYVISSSAGMTVTGRATSGDLTSVDVSIPQRAVTLAPLLLAMSTLCDGVSRFHCPDTDAVHLAIDNIRARGDHVVRTDDTIQITPAGTSTTSDAVSSPPWPTDGHLELAVAGLLLGLSAGCVDLIGWHTTDHVYRALAAEWMRMISADEYLIPGSARLPHEFVRG